MELLCTAGTIVMESPSAWFVPPGFIPVTFCNPFDCSHTASSNGAITCASLARATGTTSVV